LPRRPLAGRRVATQLSAGIVGEQIVSLLRAWHMEIVGLDANGRPEAIVVDQDASDGAAYEALIARLPASLDDVPMLTIASMRSSPHSVTSSRREHLVSTPIRIAALRDALYAAIGLVETVHDTRRPARAALPHSTAAVLVVEDNEPNRRVLRLMLNEFGIDPDEAATGHDAIAAAARRGYDIILMDVQMPDLDGLETTRRIRAQEQAHHATIVALTANALASDEARCRAAGMDGYLQKPLTLDRLSGALRRVASRS
jgi:CheY-like chemotaxis protein